MTLPNKKGRPRKSGPSKITGEEINPKCNKLGADRATIEALVNLAIRSGAMVAHVPSQLFVVPDTALLEAEANGQPYTPTTLLRDKDGRTAALYRMREGTP